MDVASQLLVIVEKGYSLNHQTCASPSCTGDTILSQSQPDGAWKAELSSSLSSHTTAHTSKRDIQESWAVSHEAG